MNDNCQRLRSSRSQLALRKAIAVHKITLLDMNEAIVGIKPCEALA